MRAASFERITQTALCLMLLTHYFAFAFISSSSARVWSGLEISPPSALPFIAGIGELSWNGGGWDGGGVCVGALEHFLESVGRY